MNEKILIEKIENLNSKLNIINDVLNSDFRVDSIYKAMLWDAISYLESNIIKYDGNYNASLIED